MVLKTLYQAIHKQAQISFGFKYSKCQVRERFQSSVVNQRILRINLFFHKYYASDEAILKGTSSFLIKTNYISFLNS